MSTAVAAHVGSDWLTGKVLTPSAPKLKHCAQLSTEGVDDLFESGIHCLEATETR